MDRIFGSPPGDWEGFSWARGCAISLSPRSSGRSITSDSEYGPGPTTVMVQFSSARRIASASVAQVASGPGPTVISVSSLATGGVLWPSVLIPVFAPCAAGGTAPRGIVLEPPSQNCHIAKTPATTTTNETSRAATRLRDVAGGLAVITAEMGVATSGVLSLRT